MRNGPSARERNRRSILDAAHDVLRDNPEATLDDVAARAGVVRRTVYGHFAGRQELVAELVRSAAADFTARIGDVRTDSPDPAAELAATVIRTWSTARRYGPLVMLARRTMDDEVRAAMAPFAAVMARLVGRGQELGVFAAHTDPRMLAEVLEGGSAAYLRAAEGGRWDGHETDVAFGHLLTLGVRPEDADAAVRRARVASPDAS
ncbi:MAG: TetR/AcrR family transcriptional regulator [Actinomycetota bacterium]|nr:TetR/AcrR family transcriptional regulator [Actinomycetota bacterium]